MADETSVIYQIGIHATADTAAPTVATKGNHVDLATAGFTVLGSRDRGDDANLGADTVTNPLANKDTEIRGPLEQAASDHVMIRNGAQEFEFMCSDVSENVYALDSDFSITSNAGGPSTTRTKRTVMIEVNGKMDMYFPKCVVKVVEQSGSVTEQAGVKIIVKPEGTTSYPAGVNKRWYQVGI